MGDMKQDNPGMDEASASERALRLDVLISRIIDGEGDGAAWSEFSKLAETDASAWRELALAQRDHAALSRAVAAEIAVADRTELPPAGAEQARTFAFRVSRWGGWAVAAALAITWMGAQFAAIRNGVAGPVAGNETNRAGLLPVGLSVDSPQEAIKAYKQLGQRSGTVLGELPERVIIESRALAGGRGFEVVYLRQFMERAQVAELYQLSHDDSGRQGMLVPVSQPAVTKTKRID